MRIAVLGTGTVGQALTRGLSRAGHDVVVGTRDPAAGSAAWAAEHGARVATFRDAAAAAELVVLALSGAAALDVVQGLGGAADGKVVVDVTNPLDFSHGFPPALSTGPNGESLAEQVQAALPSARVVKALNTVNAEVMVDPARVPGAHTLPVAGDDADAKAQVRALLAELGWPPEAVLDLGGLGAARGQEAYVLFWVALFQATGTPDVSVQVVHAADAA